MITMCRQTVMAKCSINMGDEILTYEEYCKLRKQKEIEWKAEILNVIKTGRNYLEKA